MQHTPLPGLFVPHDALLYSLVANGPTASQCYVVGPLSDCEAWLLNEGEQWHAGVGTSGITRQSEGVALLPESSTTHFPGHLAAQGGALLV